LKKKKIRKEYIITENGKLSGTGKHSYSEGNSTGGINENL